MPRKQVQVTFSKSEVSTLADLANSLASMYGWTAWRVSVDGSHIVFKAKDSSDGKFKEGCVGPSGFAYHFDDSDDDFESAPAWDEYNVNWYEDFDGWSNIVWGTDENGDVVMVHD